MRIFTYRMQIFIDICIYNNQDILIMYYDIGKKKVCSPRQNQYQFKGEKENAIIAFENTSQKYQVKIYVSFIFFQKTKKKKFLSSFFKE